MNSYQVLGVSQQSSLAQIKEAYRDLSKVFHPDKQRFEHYSLSLEVFEAIDRAYKNIGTQFHRDVYDHFGQEGIDIVMQNPQQFHRFINNYDRNKVQRLITKMKIQEIENQVNKDYLKQFYCLFQIVQTKNHGFQLTKAHLSQSLRLPECYGWHCELKTFISGARQIQSNASKALVGYTLQTKREIMLKRIGQLSIKNELTYFNKQLSEQLFLQKKINEKVNFDIHVTASQQGLYSTLGLGITQSNDNSVISLHNGMPMITMHHQSSRYWENDFIVSPSSVQHELTLNTTKHQYVQSSIKLSTGLGARSAVILQSNLRVRVLKNMYIDLAYSIAREDTIDFTLRKNQSVYKVPIQLTNMRPSRQLLLFLIPQSIPLIYKYMPRFNPWMCRTVKQQTKFQDQIEEFKRINSEVQENIKNSANYAKVMMNEGLHGLIIISAVLAESEDLDNYLKGKPTFNIIPMTEQLTERIIHSGLMMRPNSFDKLPGFYRIDLNIQLENYEGYVKYLYKGKQMEKRWRYNEQLEIGNSPTSSNKHMLNQLLIQFLFQ